MEFNYFESARTNLFNYYDSLMTIGIHSYQNQKFLLYVIDWENDLSTVEYMLTAVTDEEINQFKSGAKAFLQSKLQEEKLYHYTFSYVEGNDLNEIRLLTNDEAAEAFPTDEFAVDYEYKDDVTWVV